MTLKAKVIVGASHAYACISGSGFSMDVQLKRARSASQSLIELATELREKAAESIKRAERMEAAALILDQQRKDALAEFPSSSEVERAVATYAKYAQTTPGDPSTTAPPVTVKQQGAGDSDADDLEKAITLGFDSVQAMWEHQSWLEKHGTSEYLDWLAQLRQSVT